MAVLLVGGVVALAAAAVIVGLVWYHESQKATVEVRESDFENHDQESDYLG